MPTVSVTFDLPDALTAEQMRHLIAQVNAFAIASAQKAVTSSDEKLTSPPWDLDDAEFPAPDGDGLYSLLAFAGVGIGRPGAVEGDVNEYLRELRSEWDERDAR